MFTMTKQVSRLAALVLFLGMGAAVAQSQSQPAPASGDAKPSGHHDMGTGKNPNPKK